jgi:hypothetical protein
VLSEVRQVQNHCVYQVWQLLLLRSQVTPDMREVAVFEVRALYQFGQHVGDIAAGNF